MEDATKDMNLILGQVLGEMKGINSQLNQLLVALPVHLASDEANFKEIRKEISDLKVMVARYAGGAAVIGAAAGALMPIIIQQFVK